MRVLVLAPVWRAREEANVLALSNLFTHPEFEMSPPLFNDADIARARSRGATHFLERSDADVALWIDSDIDFRDEDALTICRQAMADNKGKYLLVVEGAIPTKDKGIYCRIGGQTAVDLLKECATDAAAVVAIGSCASWGGVPSTKPNPTGSEIGRASCRERV